MAYVSRINPQDFIDVVRRWNGLNTEMIPQFNMEYYMRENFIFLYKQIADKVYKTVVIISDIPSEEGVEVVENPLSNATVFWDGKEITVEEFLTDIQDNHHAISLLEPIDIQDIYAKHNHDVHLHANVSPSEDVFQ